MHISENILVSDIKLLSRSEFEIRIAVIEKQALDLIYESCGISGRAV
jgi:hypothetical protein